uniref:Uncharacterized protein n=1 Tax=Knipowitschia caucasica TaxID=637954 RepID=A0AAV2JIB0_KNICA
MIEAQLQQMTLRSETQHPSAVLASQAPDLIHRLNKPTPWTYTMSLHHEPTLWTYAMSLPHEPTPWTYAMSLHHKPTPRAYTMSLRHGPTP